MTAHSTPPAALLFDLDGTLINTDALHFAVFKELFAERGREIDQDFYLSEIHGKMNAGIFATYIPDENPEALSQDKESRFRDVLGAEVPPMPGTTELLSQARDLGWAMAVVTNAPRDNAHAMLAAIGLADAFDTIVIGEECTHGKPHPEPYAAAMRQLGVAPERAVVFEDSPSGLRSAVAAGAFAIGVRSSLDDAALRAAGAQGTIADFSDPALQSLLAHLKGHAA